MSGSLLCLAESEGFRSFFIPVSVGGSFSFFTPVGLFPLAVVGVFIRVLLARTDVRKGFVSRAELMYNPACLNAALQYFLYRKGKNIPVMMPYGDRLLDVADW